MGNDVKEEPGVKLSPGGGDAGQGNRRGGRKGRNRWNNPAGAGGATGSAATSSKFPTRNKEIPDTVVFDNSGQVDAANFQRSLKGMANFFHTTYSAEVSDAILKMKEVVITVEDEPTMRKDANGNEIPLTSWEEYKWKKTYAEQSGKLKIYTESMPKAYIHIYNQCSTNLKNDLETSAAFPTVDSCKDPIGLLKIIQGLCCSYDSKTQSVMATVASQKKLFTFFQRDGMDNSTYHREFMAHVDTIKTYGGMGAIGITPTFVAQKLQEMVTAGTCQDSTNPSKEELGVAHKDAQDEFLACLMLSGANRERFGPLRNELANQFGFGNDLYPKTPYACLQMMNRRRDSTVVRPPRGPPQQPPREPVPKQEEEALVFAQDSDKKPPGIPKTDAGSKTSSSSSSVSGGSRKPRVIICKTCGQQGHASTVCPRKPPAQIHTTVGTLPPDDASESSGDGEFTYHMMTQVAKPFVPTHRSRSYAEVLLAQPVTSPPGKTILAQGASSSPRRPLNKDLVLLDSQSTVHLFSQPEHVSNIREAANPIRVHCNKGTLETTQVADFGDTPVYFDSRGIANVLSLYQLGQKFKVTYDSTDRDGVFKVFTPAGVIEFKPTANGLHAINLRDHPDAAFVLVNDADLPYESPIRTVRKNYEGFTKKQVQQATTARRIMSMIGAPTEREYQGLVRLNMLPDCPITNADIVNAHKIFDTDLANLRGKTVRRRPEHVSGEIIDIPQQILDNQSNVTLSADVMFVNGVPFLVSSSRNIPNVLPSNSDSFSPGLSPSTPVLASECALSSWIMNLKRSRITSPKRPSTLPLRPNTLVTSSEEFGSSKNAVVGFSTLFRIPASLGSCSSTSSTMWSCGSITSPLLMVFRRNSALARSSSATNSRTNTIAVLCSVPTVRFMKILRPPIVCSRAHFQQSASVLLAIFKVHILF